jgi:hypothetical protein
METMKFSNNFVIRFMSRKSNAISLLALKSRPSQTLVKFWSSVGVSLTHVSIPSNHLLGAIDPNIKWSSHPFFTDNRFHQINCWPKTSIGLSSFSPISSISSMAFITDQRGAQNSTDFRIYLSESSIN